ncbi:hypothetical protein B9Z19DRAFT_376113 [Tuber borchii]|uniref:Uncharacterized protein n=1 Tax=Tuber borchii TaxID=42251 RepID=A0A2T6ZHP3_TUBBO|nr:hypothetical protein B9Z19DRAFT_376113 [Tuber borchii]
MFLKRRLVVVFWLCTTPLPYLILDPCIIYLLYLTVSRDPAQNTIACSSTCTVPCMSRGHDEEPPQELVTNSLSGHLDTTQERLIDTFWYGTVP